MDIKTNDVIDNSKKSDVTTTYYRVLNASDETSPPSVELKDGRSVQTDIVAAMLTTIERFMNEDNNNEYETQRELFFYCLDS
ncbi:unnamed protein product [Adineta steineri]|uniref:Uncharacterized protein n=1 Tax=Adineta steineri TaxID=433720 RepID=A0A818G8R5_9BILA|nr:unnamed protein product [Adineta steineri]CAF3486198.1 unnamed protein product [Adineta steineri]